ncbi:MAG: ABC transporter ATP-binding protein [Rhodospirillaceae bacterium]|nr:ABC transporter ATP-binding protein [Rhodospirillaceae bacterium]
MAKLEVKGLSKSFRGLRAVADVSFHVNDKGIVALIGPNGAGKTTCFNLIAGAMKPDSGQVLLGGRDITGLRADRICDAGIGRTFQLVKPFQDLTVLENVTVGALHQADTVAAAKREAARILELLELGDKRHMHAANLTLPDRKRLEVARALATAPKILLLDEVMAGLRPTETDRIVAVLKRLRDESGLTILLIEHVMRAVMALSDHVVVLHHGEKISEGTPEHVTKDPAVLECYLGEGAL